MRQIVIGKNQSDPKALGKRLFGDQAGRGLEALKKLNPHVDFDKIDEGTVLLVPDLPGLRASETTSIGGEAFSGFAEQVRAGLDATALRVRTAHEARLVEQKELGALLKSAPLKRAFAADPELKAQAAAAAQVFKEDEDRAKATDETLTALKALAETELAALGKLLG